MWADVRRPELRQFEAPLLRVLRARRPGRTSPSPGWCPAPSTTGCPRSTPRVCADDLPLARLGLAVIRGLLLDLVATDDEAGVDAAAQAFVHLLRR